MSEELAQFSVKLFFILFAFCLICFGTRYTDTLTYHSSCNNDEEDDSFCPFDRRKSYDDEVDCIVNGGSSDIDYED